MNTPYRKETYREYEKERLQAVVNNRLQTPKWSAVKVCLACLAVAAVVSMAVICVVRDKKNEKRNTKIFKHQVLAYLPENAAKNFPSPRGF
jgi:negative regulator of sigma E activity